MPEFKLNTVWVRPVAAPDSARMLQQTEAS